MRVTIVGGGPGGLYLACLLRERIPDIDVTVYERNRPDDTFGFGVVFSDPTLRTLQRRDPSGYEEIFGDAVRWPGLDIKIKGQSWRCGGNGFSAIERRRLISLLSRRARDTGVRLNFETEIHPGSAELEDADVLVVADGANSAWRSRAAEELGATVEASTAKFIWFGTTKVFECMTFLFEENEHGWFAVHAYPYNRERSTFVVETDEATWRAAGLDQTAVSDGDPGASDEQAAAYMEKLFADHLDGGTMVLNRSRWANFETVRTGRWRLDDRTVLLGDAAHTAHFSVGSGTKMAMEDALELADQLTAATASAKSVDYALTNYESTRITEIQRVQAAARPSLSWWEHFGEYATMPPAQFAFHFLTRSGRVGRSRLEQSDPDFTDRALTELLGDSSLNARHLPLRVPDGTLLPHRYIGLRHHASKPEMAGLRTQLVQSPRHVGEVDAMVDEVAGALDPDALALIEAAPVDDDPLSAVEVALAQERLSEALRLRHQRTVALVRQETSSDEAETLLLSGRADAVAVPATTIPVLLREQFPRDEQGAVNAHARIRQV